MCYPSLESLKKALVQYEKILKNREELGKKVSMIWNYANLNIKFLIKFVMAAFQIVVS